MSTTSISHRWKYDVFVSFRGEDIRKSFMDHLFNDFNQKGIYAFRDTTKLPKGEEISPHLYKAIEQSRFLIVIFSKDYASSSWCLKELVKILECKQIGKPKHEVQIIFYDVKPEMVRKQTGSYAGAFAKHDVSNRTEADKWRKALFNAANLSGWDLQDMTNGFESKFINSISREILKKLCDGPLHVGEKLVGIGFHFDKLKLSRFVGSHKVNMLGICGISGIGKTTLAKAIYNLMYAHFEGSCFCEDVKEVEEKQSLMQVQMQMIANILKIDDLKISSVGDGSMIIKRRMACKPILLVLDDVNNVKQLEALAGSPDWFFPGSLIIFTGKDKQLLTSHGEVKIYEIGNLDKCEALELFSLYAFGKTHPLEDFEEPASQVIIHLQGHPLAIKIFGRLLYKKSLHVWKSELDRLQTYPNTEIVQKLRPSFDSLAFDQKSMFLDIACAFIGENKIFVASVLDSDRCSANAIMEVLADRFLITVSAYCLQMHELIQSMAREIMREEFRQNHRRLWISSEDYDVLNVNKVAEEVEVLVLLLKKNCQDIPIDGQALTHMRNLRILKICFPKVEGRMQPFSVNFSGLDVLSNKLRLLYWHGFPLKFLPSGFYQKNIVAVDLSYSNIKQLWTTPKCLRRLKVMKLRYCCNLTTTPDFSEITNLEELDLEGCVNITTVHPSIGMLKRLVVLNMRDCRSARSFPSKLEMDSLRVLNLSGCLRVDQLPEALGWSKSLTELHVDRTAITELPFFVSSLINLESLSFGGQGRIQPRWWSSITAPFGLLSKQPHRQRSVWSSLTGLHMLKYLNLSYCNLEQVPESIGGLSCLHNLNLEGNNLLEVPERIGDLSFLKILNLKGNNLLEVPESIGALSCLYDLNLSGNNFTSLPKSLSQLSDLQRFFVNGCKKLEVLPKLTSGVHRICASGCSSLKEVLGSSIDSEGSTSKTRCLDSSISSQAYIHKLSAFLRHAGIETNRCEFFFQDTDYLFFDIEYRGNSIPEWFTNRSTENHLKVELPSDWCYDKFRGYGACVVYKSKMPIKTHSHYSAWNFDGSRLMTKGFSTNGSFIRIQDSYMIWLRYTKDTREWKEAKNFVVFGFPRNNEYFEVKGCGVRLICDEDIQQEAHLSMLKDISTLSQDGGVMTVNRLIIDSKWFW